MWKNNNSKTADDFTLIKNMARKSSLPNPTEKRKGDIAFFKFIRSASSVHLEKTDRHPGLTKAKHEFYPYAIWEII